MSWLNKPVPVAVWEDACWIGLCDLLPPVLCPNEVFWERDTEDRAVTAAEDWQWTHYRHLFAAILKKPTYPAWSPQAGFASEVGKMLAAVPPGEPFDWIGHHRRVSELWDQFDPDNEWETGLYGVPDGSSLRALVHWMLYGGEGADPPPGLTSQEQTEYEGSVERLIRRVVGYPWRPDMRPEWRTADAMALARGTWAEAAWDRTPILADALQDAGCDLAEMLAHLRDTTADRSGGCWAVIDVLLPAPE